MTRLVAFFLDRPLVVKLIIFGVAALGITSISNIQKEGFPNITFKNVVINTVYPGASAIDVEMNVTVPIEEKLQEVTGIQELTSTSQDGISRVVAEVDENADKAELKRIYDDIDSAVAQMDDLPDDLDGKPTLSLLTSDDIPIVEIALSGPEPELKKFARYLEERVKQIPSVTQVDAIGLPDDEVHILVDPKLARRHQVGLRAISNSIRARNMEGSGGTLESFLTEKKVVSINKFKTPEDVLDTYLRVSDLGYSTQLKKIAKVKIAPKENNLRVRNNGAPGISLMVTKSGKADIIDTIDQVKRVVDNVKKPDAIKLSLLNDQSRITRNRLRLVSSNAIVGFILVVGLLLLVFDWSVAIWTAFGIPFSFLGAFILLGQTDETLNMLTLGGFIIVLGMLVDDAIVVAENIQAYREKGMKAYDACVQAVKDIWLPVLAASLTTMTAFTPILSFGGLPGQFIYIIPLVVILALAVSLFDSYFILPAHLLHSRIKNNHKTEKKAFILWLENLYEQILGHVLKRKYIGLSFFMILFIAALLGMKFFVSKDAFPQDAAEGFNIQFRLEKGTSFARTTEVVKEIEKYLSQLPQEELIGFSSRLGTQATATNTERGSQHNIGIIFVYLHPYSDRDRSAQEIIDDMRQKFAADAAIKDKARIAMELSRVGPPMGKVFEVRVAANDDAIRRQTVDQIKKFLGGVDGVFEVEDDDIEGKDELNVELRHRVLTQAGLSVEDVLQTLRIAFDGQIVTSMVTLEQTLDFRLRLNEWGRGDINFIRNLPIQNKNGFLINMGQFVTDGERPSSAEIKHVDGKRTTAVYGNLDPNRITGGEVINLVKEKFPGNDTHQVTFAGQPVEQAKIFGGVGQAGLIAIIGVYIIISLVFNSLTQPLVIILAIPLGLIGVVFAALTHGAPMSLFAGIAMVGLTGVVVNDGIVMVHTIKEKAKGKLNDEVILKGAVGRLRPILLTTVTTILGVFPTAYGIGGMDPFIAQMCLFLLYGLLFGTLVILYWIPILFSITVRLQKDSNA